MRFSRSGTQSGNAYVFDAQTGAELASYQDLTTASAKFINDVIVTRDAAYFTNSFAAEIYRVPFGPGGSLPNQSAVQTIPLTGAWVQVLVRLSSTPMVSRPLRTAAGCLSSIQAAASLIVSIRRPEARRFVHLGAASLTNGDGLRLQGKTLFVVRNQLNQIAVVGLGPRLCLRHS